MSKNRRESSLTDKFFSLYLFMTILIFILFNFNPHVRIWFFLILKPFIHGVSNFKINFLIAHSLIIGLAVLIKKGINTPRLIIVFEKMSFISVFSAMVLGFMTFLGVVQKLKLPLDKFAYHFKDHYVTINYFAHTHTTKLPMYYLAKLLRLDSFNEVCDTALPLAEYANPFLISALTVFTLLALFCFIALAYNVITKWDKQKQWLVFITYSFASGHIIKCLIDGGMFSYDLMPSVIAVHLLFYSYSAESLSALLKRNILRYVFILLAFIIVVSTISREEALMQTPIGALFFVGIFALSFLFLSVKTGALSTALSLTSASAAVQGPQRQTDRRTQKWITEAAKVLIVVFCCLYIIFYFNIHATTDIYVLMRRVQKDDRILSYSYASDNPKEALPRVIDHSPEMLDKKIIDVYSELGENPFRNRNIAIIRPNDSKAHGFIFVLKVLKSGEEVKLPPNDFIKIRVLQNLSKVSEKAFLLKVTFNKTLFPSLWEKNPSVIGENNKFAAYYFLNHYFLTCGIKEYIIIPYYFQTSS